jgi:MarR family 2-MHQ and catechol resistance regulon transcriptional repressor
MAKSKRQNEDKRAGYYWNRVKDYGKKYQWFDWVSVETFLNMAYTYDVISNHFASKLQKSGLSRSTLNILNIISRSDQGCAHGELSELLLVSRANVTGLVDSLVRRGLVERQGSSGDRRLSIVKITKEGTQLLDTINPHYYLEMRKLASELTATECGQLNKILIKLRFKAFSLRDSRQE